MSAARRPDARRLALLVTLLVLPACAAHNAAPAASKPKPEQPSTHAEIYYAQLLARSRPDLTERYALPSYEVTFMPIDESNAAWHIEELQQLLTESAAMPAGARKDSLRARLEREIAETGPGGALRTDPLLWLDIIGAAARAPFALGSANGCDRTHRATLQLRTVPNALRSATVLLRSAPAPDPAALEGRLTQLETLLRTDLPARTEPCKESRRRAEFVEADSLAAASLAQYRHWLLTGH